jgi:hypothetical protein
MSDHRKRPRAFSQAAKPVVDIALAGKSRTGLLREIDGLHYNPKPA